MWTDPLGNNITADNDTEVIQYHIAKASTENNGTWMCTIQQDSTKLDGKRHKMTLVVVCKCI